VTYAASAGNATTTTTTTTSKITWKDYLLLTWKYLAVSRF
jgi:hypothetical protein